MKKYPPACVLALFTAALLTLAGCSAQDDTPATDDLTLTPGETLISLRDDGVLVEGQAVSTDPSSAVYAGADIIYYEADQGADYGEGSDEDGHTAQEAAAHTILTITQPGVYRVKGTLSKGQIAVDLGEGAKDDPAARVTLILDGADLTCTVAPAILVQNAYECGSDDAQTATPEVDTENAGFTLVLADDSDNTVSGAYVAKIYKPGTTDKLHKFDAAIESLVSFNIDAEQLGNGILTVNAENEGIESGLHLTINAGDITIFSKDDSVNTNEDNVSVLTINGGHLHCTVTGGTEGDGIDSNGYIVLNGGHTIVAADPRSADSGLDSDLGIYLNGGIVLASGNMYDEISTDSTQPYVVMQLAQSRAGRELTLLQDEQGAAVAAFAPVNDYSVIVYSAPELEQGAAYTFWSVSCVTGSQHASLYTDITAFENAVQLETTSFAGGPGGERLGGGTLPDGQTPQGGQMPPDGQIPPDDASLPEGQAPQDGQIPPERPTGGKAPFEASDAGKAPSAPTQGQASSGQESA